LPDQAKEQGVIAHEVTFWSKLDTHDEVGWGA